MDDNQLANKYTSIGNKIQYEAIPPAQHTFVESIAYGAAGTVVISFVLNYAIGFIMGNALEATWLLLGTLQLMSVVPLVSVYVATNFRMFCQ